MRRNLHHRPVATGSPRCVHVHCTRDCDVRLDSTFLVEPSTIALTISWRSVVYNRTSIAWTKSCRTVLMNEQPDYEPFAGDPDHGIGIEVRDLWFRNGTQSPWTPKFWTPQPELSWAARLDCLVEPAHGVRNRHRAEMPPRTGVCDKCGWNGSGTT